jgi:hypothetical protein
MKTLLALALLACIASPALALDAPAGPVVLTISGSVKNANHDGSAAFDLTMIESIEGRAAKMETPWTKGEVEFTGPYLRKVLEAAGAEGTMLIVRALNGYSAEVPFADAVDLDTILATRLDGKPMTVRTKGPLMLVYPFDKDHSLYNEKYFTRSVWQIKEIEVVR